MQNTPGTVGHEGYKEAYSPEEKGRNAYKLLNPRKNISVHEKMCLKCGRISGAGEEQESGRVDVNQGMLHAV